MTERPPTQSWEVSVSVNGETILTIGHSHLCGVENISDYAGDVRNCAQHLLALVGEEDTEDSGMCKSWLGYEEADGDGVKTTTGG